MKKRRIYKNLNPYKARFSAAKANAKAKGVDWTLAPEDIKWLPYCPVLGIKLDYRVRERPAAGWYWDSPSIDRIDSSKGYHKDNIVVISNRANRIKCDATLDELRSLVRFYESL